MSSSHSQRNPTSHKNNARNKDRMHAFEIEAATSTDSSVIERHLLKPPSASRVSHPSSTAAPPRGVSSLLLESIRRGTTNTPSTATTAIATGNTRLRLASSQQQSQPYAPPAPGALSIDVADRTTVRASASGSSAQPLAASWSSTNGTTKSNSTGSKTSTNPHHQLPRHATLSASSSHTPQMSNQYPSALHDETTPIKNNRTIDSSHANNNNNNENAPSPSRAGTRPEAIPDYVPVEEETEIQGTGASNVSKFMGKLKRNLQKTGLLAQTVPPAHQQRNLFRVASPNNLGVGLVRPTTAAHGGGDDIATKVPAANGFSGLAHYVMFTLSSAGMFHVVLFAAMTFGLVYGVYANRFKITDVDLLVDWSLELNVAFVGNVYLFVNDVPRVMECISNYHIHQQSVIHASAKSLATILLTGSGMYKQWRTDEAYMENYTTSYGYNESIYDYGLCTVAQILVGYDEILTYGNQDGAYYNDMRNPCIMDKGYKEYVDEILYNDNQSYVNWDYVVLVDQTKRMAFEEARQETIYSLANAYGPLLNNTGAIPVLVDTHSFWSEEANMTGLQSVEYFQSLIYDGVEDYVNALASVLPPWQYPVVAPIGIAYLTVYEERRSLWQKLFIADGIHSSVHGSYLFACVLYATLYGHLPERTRTVRKVEYLFADSRKLVGTLEYPTESEAYYYRNVARRVALRGYVPSLLRNPS